MQELRDYQVSALDQIKTAYVAGHRRMVLQMPTGAGKTRLAAEMVNNARGKKRKVIFEVPAISLIDQTVEMFYAEGIRDIGVIQANHHMTDWGQPIQVASVDTLKNTDVPKADVVLRDECHRLYKFDMEWMLRDDWRNIPFIGLSATPWTKGLGRVYEKLIIGTTLKHLIKTGVLCPYRVFAPSHPDLKGVRSIAGEFHQGELSGAMQKGKLVADIIDTWKTMAEERPTICFGVDRVHAQTLKERFEGAGVPAAYLDCNSSIYERKEVFREFEAGRVKVICNVDVVGMGVDAPHVACISYCRPTKSESRFVQNIGRGLRRHPSKQDLLILDHSDTHLRLGFVDDIEHLELHDGKVALSDPQQALRLPKECPNCGFLKQYGMLVCANCGHKSTPPPAVKEYTGAALEQFAGKKSHRKGDQFTLEQKALFLAELKTYGMAKEYKPGWAAAKYKDRFEVWPDWSIKNVPPATTISVATTNWIKSQNIKWAKSKRRQEGGGAQSESAAPAEPFAAPAAPGGFAQGTLLTEDDLRDMGDGL